MGSLTGVVASKSVTEASKGALRTIGNRPQSVMAKGRYFTHWANASLEKDIDWFILVLHQLYKSSASKPPTYPTHRVPKFNAKL